MVLAHGLVARHAVAQAQLQVVEQRLGAHERLVRETPGECRRGEERPLVVGAEAARAVAPRSHGEQVAVQQVVVGATEGGEERPVAIAAGYPALARPGAQVVPPDHVGREAFGVRVGRFARPGLHGEAPQQIECARPDLAVIVRGVLVDHLPVVTRAHAATAVDAGTGRDRARGKVGIAPEVTVDANSALQMQSVGDGKVGKDVSQQAPLVAPVDGLRDVREGIFELLTQHGPQVPVAVGVLRRQRGIEVHRRQDAARTRA